MPYIALTRDRLRAFKTTYKKAVDLKLESFVFDGNEYLVSYAKYLIQYLEERKTYKF